MNIALSAKEMEPLGIAGVFLFGSQANGTATEASDVDLGILLSDRSLLKDFKQKSALYQKLYELFSDKIQRLCDIDIIFLEQTDLQLQYHVVSTGRLLYLGNEKVVSDFMERTIDFTADFAPLRQEFHQAILSRI